MTYTPHIHHRRSIRLKGYDYSQAGLYFVTICIQDRECLFGKITNGVMQLNEMGQIAEKEWIKSAEIRKEINMHEYIIMPNHFHAIVEIIANDTNDGVPVGAYGIRPDEKRTNGENCVNNEMGTNIEICINNEIGVNNEFVATPYGIRPDEKCANNEFVANGNIVANVNIVSTNNIGTNIEEGVCHTPLRRSPSKTVGALVRGFKSSVTKQMGFSPWQRNYHEHIIRNETSYQHIADYIVNNPMQWANDKFYMK